MAQNSGRWQSKHTRGRNRRGTRPVNGSTGHHSAARHHRRWLAEPPKGACIYPMLLALAPGASTVRATPVRFTRRWCGSCQKARSLQCIGKRPGSTGRHVKDGLGPAITVTEPKSILLLYAASCHNIFADQIGRQLLILLHLIKSFFGYRHIRTLCP